MTLRRHFITRPYDDLRGGNISLCGHHESRMVASYMASVKQQVSSAVGYYVTVKQVQQYQPFDKHVQSKRVLSVLGPTNSAQLTKKSCYAAKPIMKNRLKHRLLAAGSKNIVHRSDKPNKMTFNR